MCVFVSLGVCACVCAWMSGIVPTAVLSPRPLSRKLKRKKEGARFRRRYRGSRLEKEVRCVLGSKYSAVPPWTTGEGTWYA